MRLGEARELIRRATDVELVPDGTGGPYRKHTAFLPTNRGDYVIELTVHECRAVLEDCPITNARLRQKGGYANLLTPHDRKRPMPERIAFMLKGVYGARTLREVRHATDLARVLGREKRIEEARVALAKLTPREREILVGEMNRRQDTIGRINRMERRRRE